MMRVSTEPLGDAMRRMGRLTGLQTALSLTDAQLLERFVSRRDEPAFAALMVRHGPMVLCLCRQMLRDKQEAEDAFQASFLVLARNAASIQKRPSLSSWLYGVAYRVAARLRGTAARRRTREAAGVDLSELPSSTEPANLDLQPVLHEEIGRLPVKYRAPVVLCYLESKTNEEAASQLRWPVGTVKARLSRARDMLRMRLARRGMGAQASVPDSLSPTRNTASILPIFLFDSTIRAAMRIATGGGAAVFQLAKLKLTAAAVLAACVLGAGTTSLTSLPPAANCVQSVEQRSDVAEKPPGGNTGALPAESKTKWQAHPFPQMPVQRNSGMEGDAGDTDCMES
jgi:RNA polymerase sigma factor (sigma-70 family)